MTVDEMVALFRGHGVPDWYYVTGGGLGGGECVGIEQRADGWLVYYSERGRKSPLGMFQTEDEATGFMVQQIDHMLRQNGLRPLL
ncbi:MAG: hypothetical protein JO212_14980 [Acetobacteraceae bacterium]|nr:hypothetical protein [Acetobacteraceae bacterium]MBV8591335.1 hypothetical protein [Acetobacteraceae bacterium]